MCNAVVRDGYVFSSVTSSVLPFISKYLTYFSWSISSLCEGDNNPFLDFELSSPLIYDGSVPLMMMMMMMDKNYSIFICILFVPQVNIDWKTINEKITMEYQKEREKPTSPQSKFVET